MARPAFGHTAHPWEGQDWSSDTLILKRAPTPQASLPYDGTLALKNYVCFSLQYFYTVQSVSHAFSHVLEYFSLPRRKVVKNIKDSFREIP